MPNVNVKFSQLYSWTGLIAASLVLLWLSWRTSIHHFVVGLLVSATVMFIALALFEGIWQVTLYVLRKMGFRIES